MSIIGQSISPFDEDEPTPQLFFDALMEKFQRVAKEKGRSLTPWKDYDLDFLWQRLEQEWIELRQSITPVHFPKRLEFGWMDQDELIDVAAFAMFLWLKLEGGK